MIRGVLVNIEGLGDVPSTELKGNIPLDIAEIPNINFFAARGEMGTLYPVKPNFTPDNTQALLSIFQNHPDLIKESQLAVKGGIEKASPGDLTLKFTFATVKKGQILEEKTKTLTTAEAVELTKALKQMDLGIDFTISYTQNQEGVIVLRGKFSDKITVNKTHYSLGKAAVIDTVEKIMPKEAKQDAIETANIVNMLLRSANDILSTHPVNERREMRRLAPANFLLIESPSTEQKDLKRQKGWLAIVYHPEPAGLALLSGMKTFTFKYPEQKTIDAYGNMYDAITQLGKLTKNILKDNYQTYEYVYIHVKELAFAGYDNKPVEKKMLLEHLDKTLFAVLKDFCPEKIIKVCVMSNVAIPCKLKVNSSLETPVLLYNNQIPRKITFTQENCKHGTLGKIEGKDFLDKIKFN